MHVVFLLGSGISRDAGMPSVDEVTAQVVSGEGVWRHTSGTFVLDARDPNYELRRGPVELPLRAVRWVASQYRESGAARAPNYEQIALVLQQVGGALSGEYESPAVLPFAVQLGGALGVPATEVGALCDEAIDYMSDSVVALLYRGRLDDHDHLAGITEACARIDRVDVATLNHDLLLEQALESRRIPYADGFEQTRDDVALWTDDWSGERVGLFKLHGATDWFDFRRLDDPIADWLPGRYRGNDVEHVNRPGLELRSPRPTFLTGTFSKLLEYQRGVFPDVHCRFRERLRTASHVAVIGYGFGDKGVNSWLIQWMARDPANRMVICHPDRTAAIANARPAIARAWQAWETSGRLRVIPAYVGDLTFAALEDALGV